MEACREIGSYFISSIWMGNCLRTNYGGAGERLPLEHSEPPLRGRPASGLAASRAGGRAAFSGSRGGGWQRYHQDPCSNQGFCFLSLFVFKENSAAFQAPPPRILRAALGGSGARPTPAPLPCPVSSPPLSPAGPSRLPPARTGELSSARGPVVWLVQGGSGCSL